jgi:hypothetical protein
MHARARATSFSYQLFRVQIDRRAGTGGKPIGERVAQLASLASRAERRGWPCKWPIQMVPLRKLKGPLSCSQGLKDGPAHPRFGRPEIR